LDLPNIFLSYFPSSSKDKVHNGSLCSVSRKGLVQCTPILSLSSVLHVSYFSNNLLSISKITKKLNYEVSFFSNYCVFKDLKMRKEIDHVKVEDGMYLPNMDFINLVETSIVEHTLKLDSSMTA
jgi:hypothetical protein